MRILGVDPGLQRTGYALVDAPAAGRVKLIEAGLVRANVKLDLAERLHEIHTGLSEVIGELKPQVVAVEQLFSTYAHPKTAILMGHARGVIFLAAAEADLPVYSYAARRVKQAVTNSGGATKVQVQRAVQYVFELAEAPQPNDVADAMAIALCHAHALSNRRLRV